jgi:hypothetical protein
MIRILSLPGEPGPSGVLFFDDAEPRDGIGFTFADATLGTVGVGSRIIGTLWSLRVYSGTTRKSIVPSPVPGGPKNT